MQGSFLQALILEQLHAEEYSFWAQSEVSWIINLSKTTQVLKVFNQDFKIEAILLEAVNL